MPPDSMTIAVTSGFGIGIIAGIVSGVCYILVHGFSTDRPSGNRSPWHCSVCGEQFRSIEGILETEKVVTCSKCRKKVCRKKCSTQDQKLWICQICQQPESWFKGILKAINPNHSPFIDTESDKKMDVSKIEEADEDLEAIKNKEKEQVREFIERLVEGMLGGGIDNVSVTQLYNDNAYLPIVGQSPCSAHASLKLLIQKIIQEAIGLPSMKKVSDRSGNASEITDRTYEDLLATAIINKIVENYQDEIPSSSRNSTSSKHSISSNNNNKEYFFGEETLDSKWKKSNSIVGDLETASVSSIEEWVRSDSSTGSTKYVDRRSLTIKQVSSSDEEEVIHIKHKKSNWKENWTLQKRHFNGTSSPIPVPMLVPNPTIDAKVLIGDREAEDTSDLSDVGSDYGDTEIVTRIESILVDSKTVIGGKNAIASLEVTNEILSDGSTDVSNIVEEREQILEQLQLYQEDVPLSIHLESTLQLDNAEPSSFDSHVEQDSEYTEKYPTLPRIIVKDSTYNSSELLKETQEASSLTNGNHRDEDEVKDEKPSELEEIDIIKTELFKGTYSEREKQKWENAVEMKHNPYTAENISKRLTKSSFTDVSSLYGRDYYIKEASKAAGARKPKTEDGDEMVTPKMQQPEPNVNGCLYQAVPAIVDPEDSQFTESDSPLLASPIPSSLLEISSDSDLSIERVYNLSSCKVYETVGGVHKEIVKRSVSPEGIVFKPTTEFDKTFTITDENHNSTTLERKRSFLRSLTETGSSEENDYITEKDVVLDSGIQNDSAFADSVIENGNTSYESIISDDVDKQQHTVVENSVTIKEITVENNNDKYSIQEFSLEFSTDGENRASTESSLIINSDPEIVDLKDKHLVKDKLGLFSKSYPNLAAVPLKKTILRKEHSFKECTATSGESVQQTPDIFDTSVNDLRKRFNSIENEDVAKKQIHSLTARSISQIIRRELQEVQNGTADLNSNDKIAEEGTTETNYFPDAKSRIKFFENLNR